MLRGRGRRATYLTFYYSVQYSKLSRMKPLYIYFCVALCFNICSSLQFRLKASVTKLNQNSKLHCSLRNVRMQADLDNVESTNNDLSEFNIIQKNLNILYKFCRPHTIKGTILASSMSVIRALIEYPNKISLKLVPRALIGLFALLCGNAYIVGINQIYDVKIDEINKPFLPIAAKLLTSDRAWQLISICVVLGVSIVKLNFSPQIFILYSMGLLFGTLYSVPPFHLKRFPILASLIIATVRGFLLNFGTYYAVREALQVPFKWNPVVAFVSCFMTVFATVIAITKDLPDVEGDIKYNVNTFANKYGVRNVANFATGLLSTAYISSIFLGIFKSKSFNSIPMIAGHAGFLIYFLINYRDLLKANNLAWFGNLKKSTSSNSDINIESKSDLNLASVKVYYKKLWNLFYLEYCLYPFI